MASQVVIDLHHALSNALASFIEPIVRKRAKSPDSWRLTLVARNAEPGHEGEWVCCTNDDPKAIAELLSTPPAESLP